MSDLPTFQPIHTIATAKKGTRIKNKIPARWNSVFLTKFNKDMRGKNKNMQAKHLVTRGIVNIPTIALPSSDTGPLNTGAAALRDHTRRFQRMISCHEVVVAELELDRQFIDRVQRTRVRPVPITTTQEILLVDGFQYPRIHQVLLVCLGANPVDAASGVLPDIVPAFSQESLVDQPVEVEEPEVFPFPSLRCYCSQ